MLHVPTLTLITILLTSLLGLLLLVTWLQARAHRILAWWAASYFLAGAGTLLLSLRGTIPNVASIEIANACVILACGSAWAGTRSFEGRTTRPVWLIAPVVAWIALCQIPLVATSVPVRIVIMSIVMAAFIGLAGLELWRGRKEHLVSRWPAIVTMSAYAIALVSRIPMVQIVDLPAANVLFQGNSWFGLVSLVSLIYIVLTSCTVLAMVKERMELSYRHASRTDSLTQLFSRRAFFEEGEAALRLVDPRAPSAVIAIDLDSFKQINDRFGHLLGDAVLVVFANVLREHAHSPQVCGRLGGEEFAILLPGADEVAAMMLAERLRAEFEEQARMVGGTTINPTLSAGVCARGGDLAELLVEADRALYSAKEAGRNRVRLAQPLLSKLSHARESEAA